MRIVLVSVVSMLAIVAACGREQPLQPVEEEEPIRGHLTPSADQPPEEEILGSVFRNKVKIGTSPVYFVTLTQSGNGACIFTATTAHSPQCLGSQSMVVMPNGSVKPGSNMWGWFDNLDTDGNPCNPSQQNQGVSLHERHDLNRNGVPDGEEDPTKKELHCVTTGSYTVRLDENGSSWSRTIDHFRTLETLGTRNVENPSGGQATDTYVHFDVLSSSSYTISNNTVRIDNPNTATLFAPGDTIVPVNVPIRFESIASTSWTGGPGAGRLMYRMFFDRVGDLSLRTNHSNPDLVIRIFRYQQPSPYEIRAEIVPPKSVNDNGTLSAKRTLLVGGSAPAPVATVTVSPSSATITTQNGTKSLTATLKDAAGNILTGRTITWSSSNTTVATVAGSGNSATVTGKANGTATITATSEGKNGTSSITVSFTVLTDDAAAAGNTLPTSFSNGSVVSVTVSMKNTGETTWSTAAFYRLDLHRDPLYWASGGYSSGTVAPQATKMFAFDLRMDDPERRGTTACFFRMAKSGGFFGAENGKDINVTGPKLTGGAAAMLMGAEGTIGTLASPQSWIAGAANGGTTPLALGGAVLSESDVVTYAYRYAHDTPRALDVVLKFAFDPNLVAPHALVRGTGASGLTVESGLGSAGEYWVRMTGTVPAGEGLIAEFPFQRMSGSKPSKSGGIGSLTLYYPVP